MIIIIIIIIIITVSALNIVSLLPLKSTTRRLNPHPVIYCNSNAHDHNTTKIRRDLLILGAGATRGAI